MAGAPRRMSFWPRLTRFPFPVATGRHLPLRGVEGAMRGVQGFPDRGEVVVVQHSRHDLRG